MVENTLNIGKISEGWITSKQEKAWISTNI